MIYLLMATAFTLAPIFYGGKYVDVKNVTQVLGIGWRGDDECLGFGGSRGDGNGREKMR